MKNIIRNKNCAPAPHKMPFIMGYADSHVKMSKYRAIFISEDITKTSATELAALLLYHDHIDHETPIQIYINSVGGDVSALINIIDIMGFISAPIHTICVGKCYSAAAFILAAGDERYALPNSQIMLHGIQFAFPLMGEDVISNKDYFAFIKNSNDTIIKLLAKYTDQPFDMVKDALSREVWLTAPQACEMGLIDGII